VFFLWRAGKIFGRNKPPEGPFPPPVSPTGQSAAPDPCAEVLKAYQDAMDERISMGDKATPDAFRKEREARAKYLECLSRGKGYTDPWWHGGTEEPKTPPSPPSPPPTPMAPPPPVGVSTPVVTPPPTKEKTKPPCDEGDTKDVASCECEVNLALVAGAKIEYAEVYQMSKEDVDKAIKGLETFLSVTAVATKLQGLILDPVETIANMIDHISTETAADAAVDGLK
jgi:hypothetical protein